MTRQFKNGPKHLVVGWDCHVSERSAEPVRAGFASQYYGLTDAVSFVPPRTSRLQKLLDGTGPLHVAWGKPMNVRFFNPAQRAREKEAARQRDEQAMASGEKTAAEVHRDNAAFAQLPLSVLFPNEEW